MKDQKKKKDKAANTEIERVRGAPRKADDKKIENNGLRKDQNKALESLHYQQDRPVKAIIREAVDWYLEALELGKINQELETAEEAEQRDT